MKAMKSFLLIQLFLLSLTAQATDRPYNPSSDARFRALEAGTGLATGSVTSAKILDGTIVEADTAAMSAAGLYIMKVAKAVWDPTGVGLHRTGAVGLGVTLPAKANVLKAWFYTKTSLVSASNDGTIAFSCASANDLFSAADIDASTGVAGQMGTGVPTGASATGQFVTASACEITATIAVHDFTGGKIDLFVLYVVAE
jgi:hypothetical protein